MAIDSSSLRRRSLALLVAPPARRPSARGGCGGASGFSNRCPCAGPPTAPRQQRLVHDGHGSAGRRYGSVGVFGPQPTWWHSCGTRARSTRTHLGCGESLGRVLLRDRVSEKQRAGRWRRCRRRTRRRRCTSSCLGKCYAGAIGSCSSRYRSIACGDLNLLSKIRK